MPIPIYLAARYSRREELCQYRKELEALGHRVTSRWLNGEHQACDGDVTSHGEKSTSFALDDWQDLNAASVCISFTEPPRSGHSRGGRHVEFGMAYATQKRCIVIGPRENVFHCLPGIEVFETWAEFMRSYRE